MNFDDFYQGRPSSSLLNRSAEERQQQPRPLTPPINSSKKFNRYHRNLSLLSSRQDPTLLINGKVNHKGMFHSLKREATKHNNNSTTNLASTNEAGSPANNNVCNDAEGDIILNNNCDERNGSSSSRTNMIADSASVGADLASFCNNPPAETATSHSIANSNGYYQRQHLGQYSSSQAQLQSMTNGAPFVNYASDTFARKTPKGLHQNRSNNRSQISFATPTTTTTTTKPMTSMLNEPGLFHSASQQQNRWLQLNASALHQQRSSSISGGSHPVSSAGTSASTSTSNVPSTSTSSVNTNLHPLPPPYSAIQSGQPSQNVICHQPTNAQQQVATTIGAFAGLNQQQQQQPQPQHSQANRFPTSNDHNPSNSNLTSSQRNNPTHQVQSSTTSSTSIANQFGAVQQQNVAAATSSNNFTFTSQQQQYPFLHNHHNHQHPHNAHVNGPEAAAALTNSCLQLTSGSGSKKSCLTCADISIKWYIVVIALLGLICALIGTIVGAVHSAGRDYISLTLLLIGVGLVLLAISWVALRITIKTYKSSPVRPPVLPAARALATPLRPGRRPAGSAATGAFLAAASTTGSVQQQQRSALLNERLYLMAAAATAMSNRPQTGTGSGGQSEQAANCNDAHHASRIRSMVSSLKERLPRPLARLIPEPATSGGAGNRRSNSQAELPEAAVAALALLHQYQQQLQLHHHHHQPAGLLFPNSSHFLAGGDLAGYRPPPPSYSASMQEQRLRMLMQERANIQQLQQMSMFPSANLPPPPPPPPSLAGSTNQPNQSANEFQIPRANLPSSNNQRAVIIQSEAGSRGEIPRASPGRPRRLSLSSATSGAAGAATLEASTCRKDAGKGLKSSASSPLILAGASLVNNNDIYVSSSACQSELAPNESNPQTTTIVNIVGHHEQQQRRQAEGKAEQGGRALAGARKARRKSAEIQILGYL